MTETRKFDEQTHWDNDPGGLRLGGAGWAPPGSSTFIDRSDPYWGHVLDKARTAYGDPNMRFNTDNVGQERQLVFGDGTAVPADGSLAYRDAPHHQTYLLNNDGTVSPVGANGAAEQAMTPAGFRRNHDGTFAPLDSSGHQIAPLAANPPTTPHGYHDANGILTPKNALGDYYIDDPATGRRTYFDTTGKPITAAQFDGRNPAPDGSPTTPTDEQQSGRAADAVRKLHEELANRYSQISDAEAKLSETLLNAHATTAESQQKLQAIQQKIIEAVNDPAMSLDTPAGEQAFLKFLRSQVATIGDIVKSGMLAAEDQAKALEALANLYPPIPESAPSAPPTAQSPASSGGTATDGPLPVDAAPLDLGLGPEEPMPNPVLPDLGMDAMGAPAMTDPLTSLASALPSMLGSLPTAGLGAGLDPLSSLTGAAAPLAGLMAQLADQPKREDPPEDTSHDQDTTSSHESEGDDHPKPSDPPPTAPAAAPPPATPSDAAPADASVSAAPTGGPAADTSPAPTTTVLLPDGSTGTARTTELAEAVQSYLDGTRVEDAYREAGITLPPPGTPVTAPIDPSSLTCGAIGMFKDHYVVAVSSSKALDNGQVVSLSSVTGGPGFLGWMDPAATSAAAPAATAPASSG